MRLTAAMSGCRLSQRDLAGRLAARRPSAARRPPNGRPPPSHNSPALPSRSAYLHVIASSHASLRHACRHLRRVIYSLPRRRHCHGMPVTAEVPPLIAVGCPLLCRRRRACLPPRPPCHCRRARRCLLTLLLHSAAPYSTGCRQLAADSFAPADAQRLPRRFARRVSFFHSMSFSPHNVDSGRCGCRDAAAPCYTDKSLPTTDACRQTCVIERPRFSSMLRCHRFAPYRPRRDALAATLPAVHAPSPPRHGFLLSSSSAIRYLRHLAEFYAHKTFSSLAPERCAALSLFIR